jgi:sugar phosphate isomerase/epimerase
MLFGSDEIRRELAEYLKRVIRLAGWLGAGPLVFGSPKNRARSGLEKNAAMEMAAHFFHELGQAAQAAGCCLTIEPNPTEYGCDFVTTMDEAAELVRRVDSPGVRLQLDAGELAMNQEDLVRVITEHFPLIHHVHASEPMLGCLTAGANLEFHREIGHRLRELHYEGFVTIEMKRHEPVEATVRESVRWVREAYGIS